MTSTQPRSPVHPVVPATDSAALAGNSVQRIFDPEYDLAVSPNGEHLLRFRYLKRGPGGAFERPVDMFRRVALNLAEAEQVFRPAITRSERIEHAERFFRVMTDGKFLPNAPTLLGAGTPLQQLHACFVLPVGDSIEEVFEALRMSAIVHSKGGGTGFSFSSLRPCGAPIATGGVSTGVVPFLRLFNAETDVIKQGGTGWGANMGVLRCDHADIVEFVRAKSAPGELTNFNLSVGVTDAFFAAVAQDAPWPLRDPHLGRVSCELPARELFHLLCEEAWRSGDPGLLFLDRINGDNPTPALGPLEATNPCGEAPLLPFEACCLGGINVAAHCDRAARQVCWEDLRATAALAVRILDNVVEASRYPLPAIAALTRRNRKLGIGVMGFADLLLDLGIPYDTPEAETLAGQLMETIQQGSRVASARLAEERGCFAGFEASVWSRRGFRGLRNATTTSNAPNSTISVIAGCSAGIEPLFGLAYRKCLASGHELTELNPRFLVAAREHGFFSEALIEELRNTGSIQNRRDVPSDFRRLFVTAHDIAPAWHIRLQAAFQRFTDLAISKTINLRRDATPADVREAFLLAHASGCKGATVFRDGCLDRQFLARAGAGDSTPCRAGCDTAR